MSSFQGSHEPVTKCWRVCVDGRGAEGGGKAKKVRTRVVGLRIQWLRKVKYKKKESEGTPSSSTHAKWQRNVKSGRPAPSRRPPSLSFPLSFRPCVSFSPSALSSFLHPKVTLTVAVVYPSLHFSFLYSLHPSLPVRALGFQL